MVEKFRQLGISESALKAIKELGFEKPSEIQEKSIPLVLAGKDIIAGASTGSGKTLAFGTGVIHNTKKDFGIQGLILTPTRELAEQITRELRKFSSDKKFYITAIYGGVSMLRQIEDLKRSEIVVATPGRLLDHLSRRTIDLQYVNTLVLDEADRMLDMGFKDDVEQIINQCPKKRQTLLYSATISSDIAKMAEKYLNNPVEVSAEPNVDPTKLKQIYYDIQDNLKYSLLKHLLEHEKAKLAMVFCNTRNNVDFIANNLNAVGIEALPIHGGFTQDKRSKILAQFHSKKTHVLVCTDVAARGLDIPEVSHVYNYDIPKEAKEYVHRIGRTARAGENGIVINIVTSRDYDNFSSVLNHNRELKIIPEKTPYIERTAVKWMAPPRGGRGNSRFGNSRGSRGYGGGRSDGRRTSESGRNESQGRSYNRSSGYGRRPSSGDGRSYGGRPSSGGRRSESASSNYGRRDNRNSGYGRRPSSDGRSGSSHRRKEDSSSDSRDSNPRGRSPKANYSATRRGYEKREMRRGERKRAVRR